MLFAGLTHIKDSRCRTLPASGRGGHADPSRGKAMDCIDPDKLGAADLPQIWELDVPANDPDPDGPPGRGIENFRWAIGVALS
jgi:hypothetical protein